MVARARSSGAVAVICIGESLLAAELSAALATRHSGFLFWTAGIHPHDAAPFDPERDLPVVRDHVRRGAVAVGECGLDYHYDNAPRSSQRAAFSAQLVLAGELGVPAVVHSRDAEPDTMALLEETSRTGTRGVMHCFTGSHALARAALDAGWYISFSGIVTFRSWTDEALLRLVPDERLLAESDAPYLAPVPNRGRRNEPAWVPRTVDRLAAARGVSAALLGEHVRANAAALFGLAGRAAGRY